MEIAQLTKVYALIDETEKRILKEHGLTVSLHPVFHAECSDVWNEFLRVISDALGMDFELYRTKTRMKYAVYMRHIAAFLLREYYPKLSYPYIAKMFDKDHTTVVHGVQTCKNLLDAKDTAMVSMYNAANEAVKKWRDNKTNSYAQHKN